MIRRSVHRRLRVKLAALGSARRARRRSGSRHPRSRRRARPAVDRQPGRERRPQRQLGSDDHVLDRRRPDRPRRIHAPARRPTAAVVQRRRARDPVGTRRPLATSLVDSTRSSPTTRTATGSRPTTAAPPTASRLGSASRSSTTRRRRPCPIGTKPSNPDNDQTPAFTFSSPDSGATFECSVDGGWLLRVHLGQQPLGARRGRAHVRRQGDRRREQRLDDGGALELDDRSDAALRRDQQHPARPGERRRTRPSPSPRPPTAGRPRSSARSTAGRSPPAPRRRRSALGSGSHTFAVRAVDQAGNHTASAASDGWTVDTSHPTVAIATEARVALERSRTRRSRSRRTSLP